VSYVQATGLRGGVPAEVRWQDGEWSGSEPALLEIEAAQREPVLLTPTGPQVAADSARAAVYLAAHALDSVESFETDIPYELEPLPPGIVS